MLRQIWRITFGKGDGSESGMAQCQVPMLLNVARSSLQLRSSQEVQLSLRRQKNPHRTSPSNGMVDAPATHTDRRFQNEA